MESAPSLRPASAALGAWIGPRLGPFGGGVSSVVPRGYDAYARVLHPVGAATWAEVCATTGATAHALMQWESIRRGWAGEEPNPGDVEPGLFGRLLDVVTPFTAGECVLGLWDGYGWIDGRGVVVLSATNDGTPARAPYHPPPAYDAATLAAPRLHCPHRGYFVFSGPLSAVPTLGHEAGEAFLPQSPNLLWPADRSWCLASEIDFDSTLIGGPTELVAALLDADGIEAWPVGSEDSLRIDGDPINGRPAPMSGGC